MEADEFRSLCGSVRSVMSAELLCSFNLKFWVTDHELGQSSYARRLHPHMQFLEKLIRTPSSSTDTPSLSLQNVLSLFTRAPFL